ncbi:hypothetical protein BZA05DRAFT_442780 [Tricharina praecox]|uniref:uncharacterized protein n=1 Tax=Tricharina praecox TaxID=43433 RepID=UPI00221F4E4F|nr:uncharacterized protein BZA05DRAFT_442780 [Tricharina praecox]KAI5856122.1 hypothetical protein BZA05DRAFT_442780 [Tricharina praecox]
MKPAQTTLHYQVVLKFRRLAEAFTVRVSCYYALIGVAHDATTEEIQAAIELAFEEADSNGISVKTLRTAYNVLTSLRRQENHDRRHAHGCTLCIYEPVKRKPEVALMKPWVGMPSESPIDRTGPAPRISEGPDVTQSVDVYETSPLRALLAVRSRRRQRKGRTFLQPLWEAADTKTHAAKEKLVLVAEGTTTVDSILGQMGWTIGAE